MKILPPLRTLFEKHNLLAPDVLFAMVLKYLIYGRRLLEKPELQDLLLSLITEAAKQGNVPARAIIYRVHEYFGRKPAAEVERVRLDWISKAIQQGAFFLRNELLEQRPEMLNDAIKIFRDAGGYNMFYAFVHPETLSSASRKLSQTPLAGIDLSEPLNSSGDTLLHIFSATNRPEALSRLLDFALMSDINSINRRGQTPLYRASMAGVTQNVIMLLGRGADPKISPLPQGPTCLHWLFHFDSCDLSQIIDSFTKQGALIDAPAKCLTQFLHYPFEVCGGTPLHWAVEMSNPDAVMALIRHGANVSIRDGRDPYECDEAVRELDMILPPDNVSFSVPQAPTMGLNSIDLAVMKRDHRILKILLSGAPKHDVNETDEEGYTAVHRLDAGNWRWVNQGSLFFDPILRGSRDIQKTNLRETISVLSLHGYELDKLTRPQTPNSYFIHGQTALMLAVTQGNEDTVAALLDLGAGVDIVNEEGNTALLSLTDNNNFASEPAVQASVTSLLLSKGANVSHRNCEGFSPLRKAAGLRLLTAVEIILQHGGSLCDRPFSFSPFDQEGKSKNVLASLTLRGDDPHHDKWYSSFLRNIVFPRLKDRRDLWHEVVEMADLNGGTVLHYTADNYLLDSCRLLLEAGVSVNPLKMLDFNMGIHTPLDEAFSNKETVEGMVIWSQQGESSTNFRFLAVSF